MVQVPLAAGYLSTDFHGSHGLGMGSARYGLVLIALSPPLLELFFYIGGVFRWDFSSHAQLDVTTEAWC